MHNKLDKRKICGNLKGNNRCTLGKRCGRFLRPWYIPKLWHARRKLIILKMRVNIWTSCVRWIQNTKDVRIKNGVKLLYLLLLQALYGCTDLALLWYDLYKKIEIAWVHYKSIWKIRIKKYHRQQAMRNSLVCQWWSGFMCWLII